MPGQSRGPSLPSKRGHRAASKCENVGTGKRKRAVKGFERCHVITRVHPDYKTADGKRGRIVATTGCGRASMVNGSGAILGASASKAMVEMASSMFFTCFVPRSAKANGSI